MSDGRRVAIVQETTAILNRDDPEGSTAAVFEIISDGLGSINDAEKVLAGGSLGNGPFTILTVNRSGIQLKEPERQPKLVLTKGTVHSNREPMDEETKAKAAAKRKKTIAARKAAKEKAERAAGK